MRKLQVECRGFTLIEVMAVIIVLAVLAVFAMPNITKMLEDSYWRQAQRMLQMVYDGEQRFFDQTGTYEELPATAVMADWRKIFVDDPNPPPALSDVKITFTVDATTCGPPPPCFQAFASHLDPMGVPRTMWIDQNGQWNMTGWPQP